MSSAQVIGFGVPINIVKAMIPQLLKNGRIEKAMAIVLNGDVRKRTVRDGRNDLSDPQHIVIAF